MQDVDEDLLNCRGHCTVQCFLLYQCCEPARKRRHLWHTGLWSQCMLGNGSLLHAIWAHVAQHQQTAKPVPVTPLLCIAAGLVISGEVRPCMQNALICSRTAVRKTFALRTLWSDFLGYHVSRASTGQHLYTGGHMSWPLLQRTCLLGNGLSSKRLMK